MLGAAFTGSLLRAQTEEKAVKILTPEQKLAAFCATPANREHPACEGVELPREGR
ncbi:hypothetical protein MWU52_16210 [Jannaschia sp. S6380]|uniref:hypothetical protein n=1 Tax=Jannaschia sp. S6380 TaxID=2926408 RepID=UPI001FF5F8F3|nr:hypothetical protein [Jannaschia sp. S6380]MCK0169100.1 hypothetical protein [Jannaschia sp. S6380]